MIIISEKIPIEITIAEAKRLLDELNDYIERTEKRLTNMAQKTDKQAALSFKNTLKMMRASYTMISGVTHALGGSMEQTFSAMFGVAVSMISTYQAIASAMAASGVGTAQAILMTASLITAVSSLVASMTGEQEFARGVAGITSAMYGLESFISVFDFG